jgi:hypothetical protein
MSIKICRPFITLRNGKILLASSVGKKAFCFEVEEEYPKKKTDASNEESVS